MNNQTIFVERRQRPRLGVMAELENMTYGILRKHGVGGEPIRNAPAAELITQWSATEGRHDNGTTHNYCQQ
ncbi:MAG TPA: hypothetical protein VFF64_11540 [Candidatus Eremiobacteraceae bacterium]|nr:hypothetical protein [Candidatus Eremiobacteraceae bacterium]